MNMKKIKHIIYLIFISIITLAFLISAFFITVMRSTVGQEKIKSYAINFARKNNIDLQIESIKGNFPLQFALKNTEVILPNNQTLKVKNLSFNISFAALFTNKLVLKNLDGDEVYISSLPKELSLEQKITKEVTGLTLPLKISIQNINLQNIHVLDTIFEAEGSIDLEKDLSAFFCNISLSKKQFLEPYIEFSAKADKKQNIVDVDIAVESNTLAFFNPWIDSDKDAKLSLIINSKGSWKNFEDLLFHNIVDKGVLSNGKISGNIYFNEFQEYNLTGIDFSSNFDLYGNFAAILGNLHLSNNFVRANGEAFFEENLSFNKISLSFNSTDISLFNEIIKNKSNGPSLFGSIEGLIIGSKNGISVTYRTNNLNIGSYPVSVFEGNIFSKFSDEISPTTGATDQIQSQSEEILSNQKSKKKILSGQISSNIVTLGESISLFSNFSYKYKSTLNLKEISLHAPSFDLTADLQITPDILFLGFAEFNFNNLNMAKAFIQKFDVNASAGGTVHLFASDGKQDFDSNIFFYDYHVDDLMGEKINLQINAQDLLGDPKFNFHSKAINLRFNRIKVENLEFITSNTEDNNEFSLLLSGKWRNPLEIKSKGYWNREDGKININIQSLDGSFLNQPYSLTSPIDILVKKDYFFLKGFEITTPSSSINGQIELQENNSDIKLVANHFPIDFLSFNPLEVSVYGYSSAELSIKEKNGQVQGSCNLNIDEMALSSIADEKPLSARGYLSASFENETLKAKGKIQTAEKDSFVEADLSLPVSFNILPFNFKIKKEEALQTELSLKGNFEDFLDFINIGNQRIEGEILANLSISNSFSSPLLKGYCKLNNGNYENYVTGISLSEINCELSAENHTLFLKSFSAKDPRKGNLSATGAIDLRESENYSFNLDMNLDNLLVFQTALVDASMKGQLHVKGNKNEAFASGDIDVTNAELMIPDKIPVRMPEIDVTFVNRATTKPQKMKELHPPYPINLDVNLHSTKNIFIKGKGVDAQLKGEVKLKGTNTDMIPDGRLELIKGSYLFAGKYFDLSESTIVFTGQPKSLPIISIGAKTFQSGVMITASLKGDLNAPDLSFSSNPPLPLSSIISLLIFGHDLSGISALQALQIATIVAALSEGGSLLETTKRNLGIDRLAVISKAGESPEDPDQIAVEVGKYITRGFLVSYRQGIEDGMSNASVEIDVGWGFILQIETISEEEQTRATLKWSHNF